MLLKRSVLIGVVVLLESFAMLVLAQSKLAIPDTDYDRVFNTRYTYIGIPIRDSVYLYAPSRSSSPTNWSLIESISIPRGTLALDGNIRKNIFMTKEEIIFEELGQYDTLRFQAELPPINPRLWIRGPQSTEADTYFLSGEKNISYYREYDESKDRLVWKISDQLSPYLFKENRTQPLLTETADFKRLYSFTTGGGVLYIAALFDQWFSFYRYPTVHDELLGDEIMEPSDMSFSIPDGAVTAFVYDSKYIAVVLKEQIEFYDFDQARKKWIKAERIKPLRFAELD